MINDLNDIDNQINENDFMNESQKREIIDPYSLIIFNANLKEIFDQMQ